MTVEEFWQRTYLISLQSYLNNKVEDNSAHYSSHYNANKAVEQYKKEFDKKNISK